MTRNASTKSYQLRADLVARDCAQKTAEVAAELVRGYLESREELAVTARRLAEQMTTLADNVEKNYRVNELGEVQSRGFSVDRLCAVSQCKADAVKSFAYTLDDEDKALVYAAAFGTAE